MKHDHQDELPWFFVGSTRHAVFQFLQKTLHNTARMRKEGIAACEGLHLAHSWVQHLERVRVQNPIIPLWAVCVPESLMNHPEWHDLCQLFHNLQSRSLIVVQKNVASIMPLPFDPNHNTARTGVEMDAASSNSVLTSTQFLMLPDALYAKLSPMQQPTGPMLILGLKHIQQKSELDFTQDVLVLDAVQDPGNVGTLLRTALAAGINQLVCTEGTAWLWGDKTLRAGMGAQFAMHVFSQTQFDDALQRHVTTHHQGVPVYVTTLTETAHNIFQSNIQAAGVWVFGHEGQGVSASWLDKATHVLRIPHNTAIESLNVAASCAICLFEQNRQRGLFESQNEHQYKQ